MDDSAKYQGEIVLYAAPDGSAKVEVFLAGETFWLPQRRIAELFRVEAHTVTYTRKTRVVQTEGSREVSREVKRIERPTN